MADIVDALIETRNALSEETMTLENIIFKGASSEMETQLNEFIQGGDSVLKINQILRGIPTGIDIIDRLALHRLPKAQYFGRELPRISTLTREVTGFQSEEELFETIAQETNENASKIKVLYRNIGQWLKNNSSTILKNALLAGLGVGFLAYLKEIQKEETGCFRYDNKGNREKIPERSCHDYHGGQQPLYPPHPLHDTYSWDCTYDITPLEKYDAGRVLEKGCKGICDPRAYNSLYRYAPPYDWQPCLSIDNERYHYVCEKGTIMRALAREVGTQVTEIFKGFNDAHIFDSFKRLLFPVLLVLLFLYINCSLLFSCSALLRRRR